MGGRGRAWERCQLPFMEVRGEREWWEGVGGWAASSWMMVVRWQSHVTPCDDHSGWRQQPPMRIPVNPAGIVWNESVGIPGIPGIKFNPSPIGIR